MTTDDQKDAARTLLALLAIPEIGEKVYRTQDPAVWAEHAAFLMELRRVAGLDTRHEKK